MNFASSRFVASGDFPSAHSSVYAAPRDSPLLASAEAKPLLARKTSYVWKTGNPVAPIWRDTA